MNRLDDLGLPEEVVSLLETQTNTDEHQLILDSLTNSEEAFAIQDEDFPILRESAHLVADLIGASAFPAWAPAAIVNLIYFLYDYRKKRILISAQEAIILREIKSAGGLTSEELSDSLELDIGAIESLLQNLSKKMKADGEPVSLITFKTDGIWLHNRI